MKAMQKVTCGFIFYGLIFMSISTFAKSKDCSYDLNASFEASNGSTLKIAQTSCSEVKITDVNNNNVWIVDLTGKTETKLPKRLLNSIKQNSHILLKLAGDSFSARVFPADQDQYGRDAFKMILTALVPLPSPIAFDENILVEMRSEFNMVFLSDSRIRSNAPVNAIVLNPSALVIDGVITSSKSTISNENSFIQGLNLIMDHFKHVLYSYQSRIN